VADHYGIEDAVVRSLNAGCDQILICSDTVRQAQAYEAIIHGLEKGTIKKERIQEAGRRVQAMKDRYQPLAAKLAGLNQAG
jgi:beta-N-acetylhexosaminidase